MLLVRSIRIMSKTLFQVSSHTPLRSTESPHYPLPFPSDSSQVACTPFYCLIFDSPDSLDHRLKGTVGYRKYGSRMQANNGKGESMIVRGVQMKGGLWRKGLKGQEPDISSWRYILEIRQVPTPSDICVGFVGNRFFFQRLSKSKKGGELCERYFVEKRD